MNISQQNQQQQNYKQQNEQEKQLLSRVSSGDDSGFWELWERHRGTLFLKCRRMMNDDTDDAQDALSMAMLRAHEKLPRYAAGVTNFRNWVLRLTENLCIDWLRKRKRQVSFDDRIVNPVLTAELSENGELKGESAEDRHRQDEMMARVYEQMKQLPLRLQEPAILRFFMRMPHKEIADKLQITGETARKRIQQARERLNGNLADVMAMLSRWQSNGNGSSCESAVFNAIREEADSILNRRVPEITTAFKATRVIKISHPSGQKQAIPVFLPAGALHQKIKVKTLENYIQRYPNGWRKRLQLAEILYARGNWDQASDQFSRVVEKHPRNLSARLLLGQMLRHTGQEQKAVDVYREAVQYVQNESTRFFLSGMVELCQHRIDGAINAFDRAAELEPWNEIFHRFQALSHLRAKRPVKALKAFEAALEVNPHDLVSLTHGYELLVEFGCLDRAEEYVSRVLDVYPTDLLALKRQVKIRCRKGLVRGDEGKITRGLIRRLKQLAPGLPMASEADTVYHFYRGEWSKALAPLEAAARDSAGEVDGWFAYCLWLYRTGDYDTAARLILKRCRDGIQDDIHGENKPAPAIYLLACDILSAAGFTGPLKHIIEEMTALYPDDWQVGLKAGLLLAFHFAEFTRARQLTRNVCISHPGMAESFFVYGRVLMEAGETAGARDALLRGWKLLPGDHFCVPASEGARLLAKCARISGDKAEEKKWLHTMLEDSEMFQRQRPAQGLFYKGIARDGLGRHEAARSAFRSALDFQLSYPQRTEAKKQLRNQ